MDPALQQIILLICFVTSVPGVFGQNVCSPECLSSQYCRRDEIQNTTSCAVCDVSCDGCTGPGNFNCKQCAVGFYPVNGDCIECVAGRFGVNCTGICHCYTGGCSKTDGECENFDCDRGWTGKPFCQIPCNGTFGSNCEFECHCPPNNTCSPVNGICDPSFTCAEGYAGPGCQTVLPKLVDPPQLMDSTCGNGSIFWNKWVKGYDIGVEPIGQYQLYQSYRNSSEGAISPWVLLAEYPESTPGTNITHPVTNLSPNAQYRFRVDVQRLDGNKLTAATAGFPSTFFPVTCPVETTTPLPGSTARPPGPHLIDETQFVVQFVDNSTLTLSWALLSNVTSFNINVTLEYYLSTIGDCDPISTPDRMFVDTSNGSSGASNITGLLPWRQYVVKITAVSPEHSITDFIEKVVTTVEIAPSGEIDNITVSDITSNTATIAWQPLPCSDRGGKLLHYLVSVYLYRQPRLDPVISIETQVTSLELRSSFGLVPFTEYAILVYYVNSVGQSEIGNSTLFTTAEGAPSAPRIAKITSEIRSFTVTFDPPEFSNGIVDKYRVTRSLDLNFTSPTIQEQNEAEGTSITVPGLTPFTLYYIKVAASTGAGWGDDSQVRNVTTKQDLPGPPAEMTSDPTFRNETCIRISWSEPDITNGIILNYEVVHFEIPEGTGSKQTNITNSRSFTVCDLSQARFYEFQIRAQNLGGYGAVTRAQFSTEQEDPPRPKAPDLVTTSITSITVALDPVPVRALTGYAIFMEDVTSNRTKRESLDPNLNSTCPGYFDEGTIIANLSAGFIPTKTNFIVGDGKIYGGYSNPALKENHYYHIYYMVVSYFQDICKFNWVRTSAPIQAVLPPVTTVPPTPAPPEETTNNTPLIVAIIVLVLLMLIALIIVLIICWYRRTHTRNPYVPHVNEKDHYDMTVFREDYDPEKYWNRIYSVRESRYIVAGRDYLPDDTHFMNGSATVTKEAPPLTFQQEFHNLPHGRLAPWMASKKRSNELKNRFPHLLPYDHSRVVLDPDENSRSDYINANFINSYHRQKAYIAVQSPYDEETVLDFWRMIYQYQIKIVVMVANIVEDNIVKCTQYWPNNGRVMYGNFVLDLVATVEYADYYIRTVKVKTKADSEWQIVHIFDFCAWPEHGVPSDPIPLLEMRHKVREYQNEDKKPVVVHCGTGVSRTGTFIAIDALLEQYEKEGRISLFSYVRKMRKDRIAMVRTVKQYVFVYEAIFEAMVAGNTRVGHDLKDVYRDLTKKNPKTGHSFLKDQFTALQKFTRKVYPPACRNALIPANINKNRFTEVIPPDNCRPILVTPGGSGRTDYINAVFLDSYRKNNHYILTQTPLHTTVIDFWKLVYDYQVNTIVMMENYKNEDDTCAEYWPEENMKQWEPFFVEVSQVFQEDNVTIRDMKLTSMHRPHEPRTVRQFQFNAWSDPEFVPKSKSMLLDLLDLVREWQISMNNDNNPVVVHCKDGATHSGLFITMATLCEKMDDDDEVDLFHTVKHLKRKRSQIIDMLEQYRFCYKALWDYVNMRMTGGLLTEKMDHTRSDKLYGSLSLNSYTSHKDLDLHV